MVKKTIFVILVAIVVIIAAVAIISIRYPQTVSLGEKVALIRIRGSISSAESFIPIEHTEADSIIELLKEADDDPNIKAVLLEINSPGGSPVASDEIASKVKEVNKTVVAWIGDEGASGAYWIASAADKIVAHPLSITCSIGAFTVVSEFTDFFEEHGFNFTTIKSGELKDTGSPLKELTPEERAILQGMINDVRNDFIQVVKENRQLTDSQVKKFSDGRPCLGKEAFQFGLVDGVGNEQDAVDLIEEIEGIDKAKVVEFKKEEADIFSDVFSSALSKAFYAMGVGVGHGLRDSAGLGKIST